MEQVRETYFTKKKCFPQKRLEIRGMLVENGKG
jgi:hypothetical protein